ncbi:Serine/threonine-protein phosphatase with EF-hands 1 [Bienertia sinuspersici]
MPMMVTAGGVALFAKLLMIYDESRSQELIERKVKNAPPGQGTVQMLTREEWEEIREVRPRTPFESKLARPNARIRTGGAVKKAKEFQKN